MDFCHYRNIKMLQIPSLMTPPPVCCHRSPFCRLFFLRCQKACSHIYMYCICQHYLTFEWFTLGRIRNPGWILLFLFLWWTDISDSSYCQCGRFYWLQLYWNLTLSAQTCTTVAELRETWARVEFTRKLCAHNSGPMLIILGVFISLFCSVLMWSCSSAPPPASPLPAF